MDVVMDADEKICPYYAETIRTTATVCKHCKSELTALPTTTENARSGYEQAQAAYIEAQPHQAAQAMYQTINVVMPNTLQSNKSDKSQGVAILLCFFLDTFGIHRFYVGKVGSGLIQACTLGGFFIWEFIDFVLLLSGSFTDKEGKKLT